MTHRTTTSLLPGIHVTDHTVDVPLDWRRPDEGRTISVFARELVDPLRRDEQLPVLVGCQPPRREPRQVQRGPEAVARPREVVAPGRRQERRIDPAEQDV